MKTKSTNIFIEVFARIWALWAMITFLVTFLIVFIPSMLTYLIPNPQGQTIFIKLARVWMNVWLALVGCRVKIKGEENIPANTTCIFTCNHNTFLDVPLTCPFTPAPNKTIAKKSFTKIPLFGFYYAKGAILVDRKSDASRRKSYEEMKQTLYNKMHVCIFPEGTRNRTKEPLKFFYEGAFKLACETQKPVIPTLLFNTAKAMPNNKVFYFLPHTLEMHFLPPVYANNQTSGELKDEVFNIMTQYYITHKQ
jgi:1-acyl-sn-glycerol-3-phosphate acyltransferase